MGLRLVNWDGEKFNKRPARNNKNETLYLSLWNKPAKKHNLSIICDDGHNYSIVKLLVYKDLYSVAVSCSHEFMQTKSKANVYIVSMSKKRYPYCSVYWLVPGMDSWININ